MNVFEERIINNNGNIKKFSRMFNSKDGIEIINDNGKISKKKIDSRNQMYKPRKKIALLKILRPCKTLKRRKNSKKMDIAGRYLRKKKSNTRKKKKRKKKKSDTKKRKKRKKKKRGFWGNFFDL